MERLAAEVLPPSMGYEWSGLSLDEQESGGTAPIIFGLGIVFVFLVLAAQYENYVDPILLTVPWLFSGHCWRSQCAASQRCLWSGWSSDADWSR